MIILKSAIVWRHAEHLFWLFVFAKHWETSLN